MKEYTPKIVSKKNKLSEVIKEETKKIQEPKEVIASIADEAQSSVNDQSKSLKNLINDSKKKARKQWKNINKCLREEKSNIKKVNLRAVDDCRITWFDEVTIKTELKKLEKEKQSIFKDQKLCLMKNPRSTSSLKACLDKLLKNTDSDISEVVKATENRLDVKTQQATACIGKMLGHLDLAIGDVHIAKLVTMKGIFVLTLAIVLASQADAISPACLATMRWYGPIFLKEQNKISSTITKETKKISDGKVLIDSIADEAQSSVDNQTKLLKDLIADNIAKARKHHKNIDKCLNAEKKNIKKLNLKGIDKCRLSAQTITKIKKGLIELGNYKVDLIVQQRACLRWNPIFPIPLRICLDGLLNGVEPKISSIVKTTKGNLNGTVKKAKACIGEKLGNLDLDVEEVREEFLDCIHKVYD
ncbi:unnamed protein product [Brassicogethes aeneus]|uniref:Uncharacterized protein n=1 Tax=Brassicogethes aeneus TaxID=1431903 RepID=A0A9P0BE35_BRAAE|nr:unnamed protein product [Brassicogethes aeneus]